MSEFTVRQPADNALGHIVRWNMHPHQVRRRNIADDVPPITLLGVAAAGLPKKALPVMLAKQRALNPHGSAPGFGSYESLADIKYSGLTEQTRKTVSARLYHEDRDYLNQLKMRKWSGISQRSAAIIGPARSEDYVAARPGSGLFVLGDGAGGTQDGAEACRIGVRAFADGYVNTDEDLYNRAPRDLGHAGKRLWVAGMAANIAIADAKINRQIASEAATTLVAVAANEGGLTTFSAGDSRAIWATQNGGRALNSEQSGGQWNNELYNAFLGGYDVRPHSTRLTAPGTYGVDEIVRYPWGSLIQPGERGVLALYSDGIGGDAGYETVAPRTLGQNVAQRLNWEGGELAWSLVMDGLKMDDRSALVGHFACHSS